jgi:hypothetical protein
MGWLLFWAGVIVLLALVAYLPRTRRRTTGGYDDLSESALRDLERLRGQSGWGTGGGAGFGDGGSTG